MPRSDLPPVEAEVPLIRLDRVGLKLVGAGGPVNILNEIDLSVAPGETVAVIGPSGSGKTSLMMVLGGLERATTGRIRPHEETS